MGRGDAAREQKPLGAEGTGGGATSMGHRGRGPHADPTSCHTRPALRLGSTLANVSSCTAPQRQPSLGRLGDSDRDSLAGLCEPLAVTCHVLGGAEPRAGRGAGGPAVWARGTAPHPREPALPWPEAMSHVTQGWQRHLVLSKGLTDRRALP